MTDKPLVSILIACYNVEQYVEEAVESAVNQTYDRTEVIALDDASTDRTLEILHRLGARFPELKVHTNDRNRGVGFTKRRLIELSSGELFGYLDPDDILLPKAAEVMAREHLAHPGWSTINSILEHCNAQLTPIGVYTGRALRDGETLFSKGGSLSHFCTFKRAMYDRTEGTDPFFRRAADIDLYLRMEEAGPIGFVPEVLYRYRRHPDGVSQGKNKQKAFFWYAMARFEACRRRGIDPEETVMPEMVEEYSRIGIKGVVAEIFRVLGGYARGKIRGLKTRLGKRD